MSLESAVAFYQALGSNQTLHQSYQRLCSEVPHEQACFGRDKDSLRQWREDKILSFAAAQGYCFGLRDLYQVWFGREDCRAEREMPLGWRMKAIAALNHQMGKRRTPRSFEAEAA